MPTYEYACTSCGHRFEAVQSFSDPALTVCPVCGGTLRKLFGNVGIVLKGSGFYKTDSRQGSANGTAKEKKPAASSDGSSPSPESKETKEPKEAKVAATKSDSGTSDKAATSSTT
jgi:putative FmdB family regulatory protein